MQCPRRNEAPHVSDRFKRDDDTNGDYCFYCGSLTEEAFMKALTDNCRLGTTTKDYKIYVYRPNPRMSQKRIVGTANFVKTDPGWRAVTQEDIENYKQHLLKIGYSILFGPEEEFTHDKFYFQHLSAENKQRFVDLLNTGKLRLDYPFNPLPFFCRYPDVQD